MTITMKITKDFPDGEYEYYWTKDGKPLGDPIPSPGIVNDVHFHIDDKGHVVMYWTKDGVHIGEQIHPPKDANDLHLKPKEIPNPTKK